MTTSPRYESVEPLPRYQRPYRINPLLATATGFVKELSRNPLLRPVGKAMIAGLTYRPPRPKEFEARPVPVHHPLDLSLYETEGVEGFADGLQATPVVLRHRVTGARKLFKPASKFNFELPSHGIDHRGQPARARAASLVLREYYGIATPQVDLVSYRGTEGSLQEVIADAVNLGAIAAATPELFRLLAGTDVFARCMSTNWVAHRAVGNIDHRAENLLAVPWLPVSSDPVGAVTAIIPVDHDLSYAAVRRVHGLVGQRIPVPARVHEEDRGANLRYIGEHEAVRVLLRPLLTTAEIDASFTRARDTDDIIEASIRDRGRDSVLFPAHAGG